ncbi:MAG: uncharacterized membrane protein (UPF0127 family) [Planctomycetota bacterium]|jgi:uncharacterized membrane protein (UPF0127 family)
MKTFKKVLIGVGIPLVLLAILILFVMLLSGDKGFQRAGSEMETFEFLGQSLQVRVADGRAERVRGLSGTERLAFDEGMLFAFDRPDFHGIWMKDMSYALDIVWFDEEYSIVHTEENVTPETYPKVFRPDRESWYVLELPAGWLEKYQK